MRLEFDPTASRIGLERVLNLQQAFHCIAPFRFPLEGACLPVPLEDLRFPVKFLSRIKIVARVRPEVRDRPGHEHLIALAPQQESPLEVTLLAPVALKAEAVSVKSVLAACTRRRIPETELRLISTFQ